MMLSNEGRQSEVVRGLLRDEPCPTPDSFYRLRGLGLIEGNIAHDCRFRCRIYQSYLKRHLL